MKYYPMCRFVGDRFSPNLVEQKSSIRFDIKNEPGEIGREGIHTNKPMPYGSAQIVSSGETLQGAKELLVIVVNHENLLRECGVEKIQYWLNASFDPDSEQCNLELDSESVKMLASLGAPLLVSVWADNE